LLTPLVVQEATRNGKTTNDFESRECIGQRRGVVAFRSPTNLLGQMKGVKGTFRIATKKRRFGHKSCDLQSRRYWFWLNPLSPKCRKQETKLLYSRMAPFVVHWRILALKALCVAFLECNYTQHSHPRSSDCKRGDFCHTRKFS
jgi:hypothetical protein